MQQISFTVDPTLENEFITVIGSKAACGMVLIGDQLTVSVFDEIASGTLDPGTGDPGDLGDLDLGGYEGGGGSILSGGGAPAAATLFAVIRVAVAAIDPSADEN